MIRLIHLVCAKVAKLATKHYVRSMFAKKHNNNPAYNARKAAQILAYFASKSETHTIAVLYAIKLIYLSDRESLKCLGFPMLNEKRVAMDHGPVNSQTFDNIKQNSYAVDLDKWSEYVLPRKGHFVSVKRRYETSELDELSQAEVGVLNSVWEQFGRMDRWTLRDWTHIKKNVPEYDEPPSGGRTDIDLSDICENVGLSKEAVAEIESFAAIDETFKKLAS